MVCKTSLKQVISDNETLFIECELAKIALSKENTYEFKLIPHGAKQNITITRQEFEALLMLPLWRLETELSNALLQLQWKPETIDFLLAVGGNCKIPAVSRCFARLFPHAEQSYSRTIPHPASLGASLITDHGYFQPFTPSRHCYRISVNGKPSLVVGRSLQCLTKDVAFIPIPLSKKVTTTTLRIQVDQCFEKDLSRALLVPFAVGAEEQYQSQSQSQSRLEGEGSEKWMESSLMEEEREARNLLGVVGTSALKRGLWEYVFCYHYQMTWRGASNDTNHSPSTSSYYTLPATSSSIPPSASSIFLPVKEKEIVVEVLRGDCLQLTAQIGEDGRLVLVMEHVAGGQLVPESSRSFIFQHGQVIEDLQPRQAVTPSQSLFTSTSRTTPITPLTSCGSPSVLSTLLADRTTSPILLVDPAESCSPIAGLTKPLYLTCPNRPLRVHSMPDLINARRSFAQPRSRVSYALGQYRRIDGSPVRVEELPRYEKSPLVGQINRRLFFLGPEPRESPVSACCYIGTFQKGIPAGKGRAYSLSHETIYQGFWKDGMFEGPGTQWYINGYRVEGTFHQNLLTGEGKVFRSDGLVVFLGSFENGQKAGVGKEYDESGCEYQGEFKNNQRNGKGVLIRGGEVIYDGFWKNGLKHGKGKEVVGTSIYEGEFRCGLREGKGKLYRKDGQEIYTGDWWQGKRHGRGQELLKGDIVYIGEYRDDRCNGEGCQLQNNVMIYKGGFVNGMREGKGVLYNADQTIAKEGTFKRHRLNGEGKIYHGPGKGFYEGMIVDNFPCGKGREVTGDGEVYEGEFQKGKRHGSGMLYNARKELVYMGHWYYGYRHGYGEGRDENGFYCGEYLRGNKHGHGVYMLHSGDKYEGEFMDDQYNGAGKYMNATGKVIYEGEYRNGKRNGRGKLFLGNGEYYHGMFLNDLMSGKGTLYYENGMPSFVGEFRDDMRNGEGVSYDSKGNVVEKGFYVNNQHICYGLKWEETS